MVYSNLLKLKKLLLVRLIITTLSLLPLLSWGKSNHSQVLIRKLVGKNVKVQTSGCSIDKKKIIKLILAKEPTKISFKFNKTCDVEGSFTAKMEKPFYIKLKFKPKTKLETLSKTVLINLIYDPVAKIKVKITKGYLVAKEKTKFKVNFVSQVDPFAKKFLSKLEVFTLKVLEVNSKKVNKTYNLK